MNRCPFLLNKYNKEFFHSPAAKSNHHAFNGGSLSYYFNAELAKTIDNYYPNINRSLLYSGLILHDLGKVIELSGPTAEYTLEGQLIGHIVLVDQEITEACEELKIYRYRRSPFIASRDSCASWTARMDLLCDHK